MKKAVSLLIALLMIISVAFSVPATAYALETDNAINATESNVNNEEESLFMRIIRTIFFSKLTFDSNGGSEVPYQYAFKFFGRFSTPAEPTKEGYTFDGWEPEIPARAPFGNVNVKAKWSTNIYNVKWIVDGVTYSTVDLPFGVGISKPEDPQKEGYTFTGWTPTVSTSMPARDITYTAQFSVNHYSATLNAGAGIFADGTSQKKITVDYGTAMNYEEPTREGYDFAGWDIVVPAAMPARDLSCNATWVAKTDITYTVYIYVMDVNGTYYLNQKNLLKGETDTTVSYTPKPDTGFQTASNSILSAKVAADGSTVLKVYYARNQYTIKFDLDNGTAVTSRKYYYGATVTPSQNPQKEGYNFVGWTPVLASVTKSVTYKAEWKKITEVITVENSSEFAEEVSKLTSATINKPGFDAKEASNDPYYTCRIVAKVDDLSQLNIDTLEADKIIIGEDGLVVFQFANESLAESCVSALNGNNGIDWVIPDVILYETTGADLNNNTANDTWANNYLHTTEYANYIVKNNLNREIKVAVVDSGVDMAHPDFENRIEPIGVDLVDWGTDPSDVYGHGTEVAGIIAACTPNLNVKIVPIRTMNQNGVALGNATGLTTMSLGIKKAVELKVDVINFSCGSSIHLPLLEEAVQEAINAGIVVVISAGNGDVYNGNQAINTSDWCPSHIEGAIVVGAIDKNEKVGYFSNYGESIDFVAPGINVYSSKMGGGHTTDTGTSFAAPFISAVAAMVKMVYKDYTPLEVEDYIKRYCKDISGSGWNERYGNGLPNLYDAIPGCNISLVNDNGSGISTYNMKSGDTFTLPTPSTKSYTVTFNANGGSVSPTSKVHNCTFDGWYENSGFTGTRHAAGSSVIATGTKRYYAKWKNPSLSSPTPTWNKHVFMGWFTSSSAGSGTKYTNTSTVSENLTLYAQWLNLQLSSTSGSASYTAETGGSSNIWRYTGLGILGWDTSLPTPSNSYLFGYSGYWELISGNGTVSGNYLYMRQPGTYKLRYHIGNYQTDIYTFSLTYGKRVSTTERNKILSTPGGSTILGYVPAGAGYVSVSEVAYTGSLSGAAGHAWGKVTYNGITGWITLCYWDS